MPLHKSRILRSATSFGALALFAILPFALSAPIGPIAISVELGQPVLRFSSSPDQAYVIETATNLPASAWQKRVTVTGDVGDIVWADDRPPVQTLFYRVFQAADPAPFLSLQQALRRACTNQGIVGASAAAMLPDHGLWIGTFGTSDGVVPIRPQTPFEVGSVTKMFVAATILRLAEEGRLTLDDTVGYWLPGLNCSNISPAITIRQLLSHRAGTYNFGDDIPFRQDLFSDWSRHWQPEEVFKYVRAPYFAPGADGQYSNTGYVVLGMIIRSVSGRSLAEEMRRTVLARAGLTSTFMGADETWKGEMAHPHLDFNGDGIHEDLGGKSQTAILTSFWTSGAEISTAADLVQFGMALFEGGLLNENSLASMRQFQSIDVGGVRYDYGLGLMRLDILGREHWAHSGGLFGEFAWLSYCPSTHVALGVAYNYPNVKAAQNLPGELLIALSALADAQIPTPAVVASPARPSGTIWIPFLNAEISSGR